MIDHFDGEYRFLSNFYKKQEIFFEGAWYSTVEHAYQAAKTTDPMKRTSFYLPPIIMAGQAKRLGRDLMVRTGWEDIKLRIMESLVRQKFLDRSLLGRLLATGDAALVEGNNWHDQFWGRCNCGKHLGYNGLNHLGEILMQIRKEMRNFSIIFSEIK